MKCSVTGCDRDGKKRTYCETHYQRFRKFGDAQAGRPIRSISPKGVPMGWILEHKTYVGEDCLKWPFYCKPDGYASMFEEGQTTNACHVMCREAHGPKPGDAYEAAHSCGNGHLGCVHPEHLRWATHQENGVEALDHGRHKMGSARPNSKLTEADVVELRHAAQSGITHRELAIRFGISGGQVSLIRHGKRWGWLKEGLAA